MTGEPNKERIQKFVDALRSGKYTQIFKKLTAGGDNCEVCAEGVACDVYCKEFGAEFPDRPTMPSWIQEWYGFSPYPIIYLNTRYNFIVLNDQRHLTFYEIADLIEDQYLKEPSK